MNVLKATSWEQESYPIPKDLVFVPLLALIFPTVRLFLDRYVFEVNSLPVLFPMLNPFFRVLSYDFVCFFFFLFFSYNRKSQLLLFCYCYVSTARFSPILIVQIWSFLVGLVCIIPSNVLVCITLVWAPFWTVLYLVCFF